VEGLDLKQAYKDLDSYFLIKQGVKGGIARRVVDIMPLELTKMYECDLVSASMISGTLTVEWRSIKTQKSSTS